MFVHRVSSTRVAYLVSFPSQRRTLPWCLQRQYHVVAARDNLGGGSGLVSCHPYSLEDKRYRLQQYQRQSKARMASNPFSNVSSWVRDVVQSKSLQPPNPILKYTKSVRSSMANDDPTGHPPLPRFSYMLPYHLESAAQEVIRQYHEEMAQLEVSLTATSAAIPEPYPNRTKEEIVRILQKLDRLEAPIQQVLQIGHMLSQLTDDHEDLRAWERALHKVQEMMLNDVEFRSSYIVYNSLEKSMDSTILPPRLLHSFCVGGAQYHDLTDIEDGRATTSSKTINEAREELREIQYHILQIRHRLLSVSPNFMELPKPNQLQTLSDLYQIIGLTWQQARLLGYQTVCQMEMGSTSAVSKSRSHMVTSVEQIRDLHQQVMEIIRPYVKEEVAQLDQAILQEVLGGSAGGGDSKMAERRRQHQEKEQRRLLWHARHAMKQYLTLDGVLEGLFDWTQTLLGISVEEVVDDSGKSGVRGVAVDDIFGWHQNVRLFEVYYDASVAGNISGDDENENSKLLLGRFYLDPYERSAKPRTPNTWLFSQRFSQSMVPVVVMSLCMDSPAWKDDPTLLTWDMVRSLLHQYGKALQLILSASAASPYQSISLDAIRYAPVDVSEFLPYVSTLSQMALCSFDYMLVGFYSFSFVISCPSFRVSTVHGNVASKRWFCSTACAIVSRRI